MCGRSRRVTSRDSTHVAKKQRNRSRPGRRRSGVSPLSMEMQSVECGNAERRVGRFACLLRIAPLQRPEQANRPTGIVRSRRRLVGRSRRQESCGTSTARLAAIAALCLLALQKDDLESRRPTADRPVEGANPGESVPRGAGSGARVRGTAGWWRGSFRASPSPRGSRRREEPWEAAR